jgi:hypothetical protein
MNPRVFHPGRSFVAFFGDVSAAFLLHVNYACSGLG